MFNRFILIVVFVPLAVILIALAVANRGVAAFTLDPFNPGNPALTIQLPLFVLLFATLAVGLLIGSFATWWKQRRYRKLARLRDQELQDMRAASLKSAARPVPPAVSGPAG